MIRLVRPLLILVVTLFAGAALAGDRVALVMGNSSYQHVGKLGNPANDASDFADALKGIGFDVTLALDLDYTGMHQALQQFAAKADGADMALIYFAGHGIEIDKENYLIPVDAKLETDRSVMLETIPLDLVTETISGAKTLRMVLLDACRNNPFLAQMAMATPGRAITRGLSPFEPTGGTLVAFAAKGGTVALDGNGRNSPFMHALLEHVDEPGVDISLLFRKVRDSVLEETLNQQEPFTYGSLPGHEIYLVPPVQVAASAPGAEDFAPGTPSAAEESAWAGLKDTADRDALQQFILAYPRGVHASEAFERIVALSANAGEPQRTASHPVTTTQASPPAEQVASPPPVAEEPVPAAPVTTDVAALPTSPFPNLNFTGPVAETCGKFYDAWKFESGAKAFAVNATRSVCGYAVRQDSLQGATDEALRNCTAQQGGSCTVVAARDRR